MSSNPLNSPQLALDPEQGPSDASAWAELARRSSLRARADVRNVRTELSHELALCLEPEVHENLIRPYGAIVCAEMPNVGSAEGSLPRVSLAEPVLRTVADGRHGFALVVKDQPLDLVLFESPKATDDDLAEVATRLKGIVVCNDAHGVVRIVTHDSVTLIEGRRWLARDLVRNVCHDISRIVPAANPAILGRLLAFCHREISASEHGAILLYVLTNQDDGSAYRESGIDIRELRLSIRDDEHNALIAHQVTYRDGALLFDPDGILITVNLILQPSGSSERAVGSIGGTRHTSAARHTYDCPNILAFVVSADGPVRVFSDGKEVGKLKISGSLAPHYDPDAREEIAEIVCPRCGATLALQTGRLEGLDDQQQALCPLCHAIVAEERCWFLRAFLRKTPETIRALLRLRESTAQ